MIVYGSNQSFDGRYVPLIMVVFCVACILIRSFKNVVSFVYWGPKEDTTLRPTKFYDFKKTDPY